MAVMDVLKIGRSVPLVKQKLVVSEVKPGCSRPGGKPGLRWERGFRGGGAEGDIELGRDIRHDEF
jgi:hypothetical protein